MFDAHCAFAGLLRLHSYPHDSFDCLLSCFVLYFFGMSFARIHKTVFEISCLQELVTRILTHRHTDTTEYIISRRR